MRSESYSLQNACGASRVCSDRLLMLRSEFGGHSHAVYLDKQTARRSSKPEGRHCHTTKEKQVIKRNVIQTAVLLLAALTFSPGVILYGMRKTPPARLVRKNAWDMLWAGAHSSDAAKRSSAIRALGLLPPSPLVVKLAEDALQDQDSEVREAAATALGEMHSSSSIPELKKALSDSDLRVALAASRSLLLLKQKTGYDVYYAVLTGRRKTGQSLLSQQLNQIDTPKKIAEFAFDQGIGFLPYAGYGMEVIQALKKKDSSPLRAAAARVLARDPDPRSGQALAKACSDEDWIVREAALRAIALRGNPALLPSAEAAMQDNNNTVRYVAAAAALRLASIRSE